MIQRYCKKKVTGQVYVWKKENLTTVRGKKLEKRKEDNSERENTGEKKSRRQ